ncbi:hypothetical protein P8452_19910 [Trifolium repens]|nr:hypothetical protein P8452_19910 [Trifolium repens]
MMQEDKKMKVKKGWLAVQVGLEEEQEVGSACQKFVIPISYLYHPLFKNLLDQAYDVYGYHTNESSSRTVPHALIFHSC